MAADETVLITGASSGIGWELARLFAADKSALVLVARREEKLKELAGQLRGEHGVNMRVVPSDLTDPTAAQALLEELERDRVSVDVLVNNAGFGALGPVSQMPIEQVMGMVQVNVVALTHLTRLFLPGMIERGRGGILNIGSTAGFQAGPYMAVYYATKAYVLSFTEALAEELAGSGVRVSCLAPGATVTEFAARAGVENMPLFRLAPMDFKAVARAGYEGFRRGRLLVIPGVMNQVGAFGTRLIPRSWARKVAKRLQWPG